MAKVQAEILEELIKQNCQEYQEREVYVTVFLIFISLVMGALIIATIVQSVIEVTTCNI